MARIIIVVSDAVRARFFTYVERDDLALDLTRETPTQLHDHLARMSFVRPRARRALSRTQRG